MLGRFETVRIVPALFAIQRAEPPPEKEKLSASQEAESLYTVMPLLEKRLENGL